MAHQKKSACTDAAFETRAQVLKAIGHPVRLQLLCTIEFAQDSCVSDLWRCLGQPQPVISQHLAVLKAHGIVSAEVQKTKRVYTIIDPFVKELVDTMLCEQSRRAKKA